jgi:hypothetical protein
VSGTLLVIVSLIYLGVGLKQAAIGNYPMAVVFVAYAVANIAMIWTVL